MAPLSRVVSLAVCGATLLIALTACAAATPASTPSLSAPTETSATETPTPTPIATTAPVQDPADPSTWLITTAGIGPSQLGDLDDDEIVASVAPAFVVDMRCEGLTAFASAAPDSPLSLFTAVSGTSTPEHPGFFRAVGISAPDAAQLGEVEASPTTAEGIRLGSPLSDLRAAHPSVEPWSDPRGETPDFTHYVVSDSAGSLLLAVKGDRIISITATFDLPPVGFCS